jgi:hypothetical protein
MSRIFNEFKVRVLYEKKAKSVSTVKFYNYLIILLLIIIFIKKN